MKFSVITPTTITILSLSEIKSHIRIRYGETKDDDTLKSLRDASIEIVEKYTGRKLGPQTIKVYYDDFPDGDIFEIPVAPLRSIPSSGLLYTNSTGQSQTFSSTKYNVDSVDRDVLGRVVLKYDDEWPTDTLDTNNPVSIECNVGYSGSTEIPEVIKHAMKLIIGAYFESREDFSPMIYKVKEIPMDSRVLLGPYRVKRYR